MVRQFRHGVREYTLEVPGGMVDPEDESPLAAAAPGDGRGERLRLRAHRPDRDRHPNPAIQGNRCHSFVAYDVGASISRPLTLPRRPRLSWCRARACPNSCARATSRMRSSSSPFTGWRWSVAEHPCARQPALMTTRRHRRAGGRCRAAYDTLRKASGAAPGHGGARERPDDEREA